MSVRTSERRLALLVAEYRYFQSHRLGLARAAVQRGYRVHVLTRVPEDRALQGEPGMEIVNVPMVRSLRPCADMRLAAELTRQLRRIKPDIVHNVSVKLALLGSLCALRVGVPAILNAYTGLGYVFRADGAGPWLIRKLAQPVLAWITRRPGCWAVFQNDDDRECFRRLGLLAEARTELIPGSGVDTDDFAPAPEPEGVPVVAFVGRLIRDKGIGEFVAAAERLSGRGARARFVAVGEADEHNPRSVDEGTIQAWRKRNVVEWWGYRPDMDDVYRKVHVVCLPSHHEGLPKVLLEGAASGRPLVATDIAGCRLVVRDGVNGFLVPKGNPEQLADALEKLILNKELRVKMGAEGRRIVERRFRADLINGQILDLYERMTTTRRGGGQ